jgi:hypothetical protein
MFAPIVSKVSVLNDYLFQFRYTHRFLMASMYKLSQSTLGPICNKYKRINKEKITYFQCQRILLFVCLMVFNATFNNIPVISWRSVLLVEQVTDKLYHIMLYTLPWSRFELTTSVVIGTDCIGSCKSNSHMITTAPHRIQ